MYLGGGGQMDTLETIRRLRLHPALEAKLMHNHVFG